MSRETARETLRIESEAPRETLARPDEGLDEDGSRACLIPTTSARRRRSG